MTGHRLVLETEDGLPRPARVLCDEPAHSICHAVWDCDCESLYNTQIRNGLPAHQPDPEDDNAWHAGTFGTQCGIQEWFDNSEDSLIGTVAIPIIPKWSGDWYLFDITPEADH